MSRRRHRSVGARAGSAPRRTPVRAGTDDTGAFEISGYVGTPIALHGKHALRYASLQSIAARSGCHDTCPATIRFALVALRSMPDRYSLSGTMMCMKTLGGTAAWCLLSVAMLATPRANGQAAPTTGQQNGRGQDAAQQPPGRGGGRGVGEGGQSYR